MMIPCAVCPLFVDCAENDLSDWIEIPASSEVENPDELGRDIITSQPTSAKRMLGDVSGYVATWQKPHKIKTDRRMTYPACDVHSAVSINYNLFAYY